MGLHRRGSKRGLTRRQAAALQDRWDREDAKRQIEEKYGQKIEDEQWGILEVRKPDSRTAYFVAGEPVSKSDKKDWKKDLLE